MTDPIVVNTKVTTLHPDQSAGRAFAPLDSRVSWGGFECDCWTA